MTTRTNSVLPAITSDREYGGRHIALLALPRADYVRSYEPLVDALIAADRFRVAVAVPPDLSISLSPQVKIYRYPFYSNRRGAAWLPFAIRRERAARAIANGLRPHVVIVPSDVSDTLLGLVMAARLAGAKIAYVQGAMVFPDYVARNAATDQARLRARPPIRRLTVDVAGRLLRACGVHAVMGVKGVLGEHADWLFVANDAQRRIHEAAGHSRDRIVVSGAPFREALEIRARRFSSDDVARVRAAMGIDHRPLVIVLTKSLFRLGWTTRGFQEELVKALTVVIRRELPDWHVVIKLHPAEDFTDYEHLAGSHIRIVKDVAVEDLLLAADLAISVGGSSPALAAPILGIPVIVFSPDDVPMLSVHHETSEDVLVVQNLEDLAAALRRAKQASHVQRFQAANGDGASSRIVEYLQQALSPGILH